MTTNFSKGLSVYGIPLPSGGGMRFSSPWANHRFVDYDNGSDSWDGLDPSHAFKTIQAAVTASSAQDVIYIRPRAYQLGQGFRRYEEDITITQGGTTGTGNVATNAQMSLIGVTPKLTPSDHLGVRLKYATATPLTIQAPGCHVENLGIFAEGATYAIYLQNGTSYVYQGHVGASIYNCEIKGANIYSEACDETTIAGCRFQAMYDGTVAGIVLGNNTSQIKRPVIRGCEFIGGNANNMSGPCITMTPPVYDAVIRDCYFNADPDGSIYINISGAGSTGSISNCYFAVADISTGRIVEGGLICSGIYDEGGLATAT